MNCNQINRAENSFSRINELEYDIIKNNPYLVDKLLTDYVHEISLPCIDVLGISIFILGVLVPTGRISGNPHSANLQKKGAMKLAIT